MSRQACVLVVGAGPTGLALALMAHEHGAAVRIIDRRREIFRPSRALILHPRTLEALRPLGVTNALLARADTSPQARLYLGKRVLPARLGELALADTAFPHLSLVRQMDVETVLSQALSERGIEVERGTEMIQVEDGARAARARLRTSDGVGRAEADFIVGCDGQESRVRRQCGIAWPGKPYEEEVLLADVELDTEFSRGMAHVVVGRRGLLFIFALGERATWRMLVTRPAGDNVLPFGRPGPSVPREELQSRIDETGIDARITDLVWSAGYRLQNRLASRFRQGRVFLAGDAAHAHSPALGQGMNTGIQDAINLGWKLSYAPAAEFPDRLLDSYELERRPVARRVLALTHLGFLGEASSNPLISFVRGAFAPPAAPVVAALLRQRRLVAQVIRIVSQLRVVYRDSPISVDAVPHCRTGPRPGARLPDELVTSDGRRVGLHGLIAKSGVHVLLSRDADRIEHGDFGRRVTIHRLASRPGAGMFAIRPDGHIGLRCGSADEVELRTWLSRVGAVESV